MDDFGSRHLALIAALALAACSDDGGSSSGDDGFGNLLGSADEGVEIVPGTAPAAEAPADDAEPDVPTTTSVLIDADGDGFPDAFGDDAVDVDLDGNGIPDFVEDEAAVGAGAPVPIDVDGDGIPDLVPGSGEPPTDPLTLAGLWDATFRTEAGLDVVYVEFTDERTFFVHDYLGDEAAANTSAGANCYRSAGGSILALGGALYRVVAPGGTIDFVARLEGGGLSFALVDAVFGVTPAELLPPVLGVSPTDLVPCGAG